MTWNLENFQRPAAGTDPADYDRKLTQLVEIITAVAPDLLAVQEVLADPLDPAPASFQDLRTALTTTTGAAWNGIISSQPDQRGIRVG
ncbi:MAG TPA: endonuclease/exonuclease/phosphatase family protein, partial [Microlunatus sp.]|nr:endonuclease/exonuclease/phosphatase family protein [Microlunatus sp.]